MMKVFLVSASVALAVAACANPQDRPKPDIWTVNYNVPFDAMVDCLAAPPAGAFTTYAPAYMQDGVARIVFMPANTPQAQSAYVVTHGGTSQVSRRRIERQPGLDRFDGERARANRRQRLIIAPWYCRAGCGSLADRFLRCVGRRQPAAGRTRVRLPQPSSS
jgi:hypothetical protein